MMVGKRAASDAEASPPLPAVFLRPGEGELLDYGDGDTSLVLASGDATGGAFTVVEHRLAPGAEGPPLHRHRRLCEAFYVLEGRLTLRIGSDAVTAPEGSFACFPPGVVHGFANATESVVRVLNINAPGGWDNVLRALVAGAASGPLDGPGVGAIASERDMEVVDG
jgi:quercetin dioxygenase-like cupin family protein